MNNNKRDKEKNFINISGIVPNLHVKADLKPRRSESGIGALMPWADRLWLISYTSDGIKSGAGTGLFEITENFRIHKKSESVVGTYANRMIHSQSDQIIIGPHIIDTNGNVKTIKSIQNHRIASTMEHLNDPENKVYFLTMEGLVFEVDVNTLKAKKLFDVSKELDIQSGQYHIKLPAAVQNRIPITEGAQPHFKAGFTSKSRVVIANNTYDEYDFEGRRASGRLAEWDGKKWNVLERTAFNEVTGRKNMGNVIFATGWDKASAILKVFVNEQWSTYRLPKASHTYDHYWQTEWPRIREVESERYLMDCHGMFYELSPIAFSGKIWGVRPISTHLRVIPDFCSWQGFLILGGNQVSPIYDTNIITGQPQSGLWFGKTDDLWKFGKPKGWGGPWWEKAVIANYPSDPYLMMGFDQKILHLYHNLDGSVKFTIEVDFLGNQTWKTYDVITVPLNKYMYHIFPTGFSSHWVRISTDKACIATAYFIYS